MRYLRNHQAKKMSQLKFNDDTLLHAIGERLKELRAEHGLEFKEMAKVACIDRDNYMRVERGERNSSIGIFCNIASGLEIKVSEIFNSKYLKILRRYEDITFLKKFMNSDESKLIKKTKVINILKKYRMENHISQTTLAIELGVSRNMINNLEYGRGKVKVELLIGIMTIYDISAEELLNQLGTKV